MYRGKFEILWCNDLKSYKKLIPTLLNFQDLPIITADDDVYYHPQWLERLWKSYTHAPNCIHAHMVSNISFDSYLNWHKIKDSKKTSLHYIGIGVGGILYPPNCLHKDIFNIQNFQKLAPLADDLYFWAMAVLNGTKTKLVDSFLGHPRATLTPWDSPNLYTKNCGEKLNDLQFNNILRKYPQIITALNQKT